MRNCVERKATLDIPMDVSCSAALDRIELALSAGHVRVQRSDDAVKSTDIPVPLINIDRRLYSRRNGVGINPFVYLTSVTVSYRPNAAGQGTLQITLSRARGLYIFGAEVTLLAYVAAAMPHESPIPVLVLASFGCLCYAMLVFGPARLALRELHNALRGRRSGT